MKHIHQIEELMRRCKSIDELTDALKQCEIPAWYGREADESFKREQGINVNEKWHRYFVETSSTPINQWENLPHYTCIVISDNLKELRIVEKS